MNTSWTLSGGSGCDGAVFQDDDTFQGRFKGNWLQRRTFASAQQPFKPGAVNTPPLTVVKSTQKSFLSQSDDAEILQTDLFLSKS